MPSDARRQAQEERVRQQCRAVEAAERELRKARARRWLEVAKLVDRYGASQRQVAELVGMTQPRVHKALKAIRGDQPE